MIEQNFETGTKTPLGLEKPNTVFYVFEDIDLILSDIWNVLILQL